MFKLWIIHLLKLFWSNFLVIFDLIFPLRWQFAYSYRYFSPGLGLCGELTRKFRISWKSKVKIWALPAKRNFGFELYLSDIISEKWAKWNPRGNLPQNFLIFCLLFEFKSKFHHMRRNFRNKKMKGERCVELRNNTAENFGFLQSWFHLWSIRVFKNLEKYNT